jgi:hypothetical protein
LLSYDSFSCKSLPINEDLNWVMQSLLVKSVEGSLHFLDLFIISQIPIYFALLVFITGSWSWLVGGLNVKLSFLISISCCRSYKLFIDLVDILLTYINLLICQQSQ